MGAWRIDARRIAASEKRLHRDARPASSGEFGHAPGVRRLRVCVRDERSAVTATRLRADALGADIGLRGNRASLPVHSAGEKSLA